MTGKAVSRYAVTLRVAVVALALTPMIAIMLTFHGTHDTLV